MLSTLCAQHFKRDPPQVVKLGQVSRREGADRSAVLARLPGMLWNMHKEEIERTPEQRSPERLKMTPEEYMRLTGGDED